MRSRGMIGGGETYFLKSRASFESSIFLLELEENYNTARKEKKCITSKEIPEIKQHEFECLITCELYHFV